MNGLLENWINYDNYCIIIIMDRPIHVSKWESSE